MLAATTVAQMAFAGLALGENQMQAVSTLPQQLLTFTLFESSSQISHAHDRRLVARSEIKMALCAL